MDNVIFMSELCDAAADCNRTINYTMNNFSNIANSSSNASNNAQNAVKNIGELIQEVTPNIGIQGIIGGWFWKPKANTKYVAQVNGSLIMHTEWTYNENSETHGSYDFDDIYMADTISNVTNTKRRNYIAKRELMSIRRYNWTNTSGSYMINYETYSKPIPILKNYVYYFISNKCNYCFIETIN